MKYFSTLIAGKNRVSWKLSTKVFFIFSTADDGLSGNDTNIKDKTKLAICHLNDIVSEEQSICI